MQGEEEKVSSAFELSDSDFAGQQRYAKTLVVFKAQK